MKNLVIVLIGLDLLGAAHASPKVVNMQLSRVGPRGLSKRGTVGVDAVNLNEDAMYRVNVEVGNPPQPIGLLLDTGSSDTWMFGPNSCDTNKSPCFGGDCEYPPMYPLSLRKFQGQFAICLEKFILKNIAR